MRKKEVKNKSLYWKKFPEQYTVDEDGKIIIHEDADEEVKRSYKQYTYEQMMMGYFEEEEEEEEVERTFSISESSLKGLKEASEGKPKKEIKELKLQKDYSMYSWFSYKQYYDEIDGKIVFHEDTPQEILDSYKLYNKQVNRVSDMKNAKGFDLLGLFGNLTGVNLNKKKKKK